MKRHLLAPGPTPVPEEARLAMAASLMHHRGPEFKAIFHEVRDLLRWVHQTENDVLALTCSGTGAFEAAMTTFTRPGDTVVWIGGGKFGERWGEMAAAFGMTAVEVPVEWGKVVDPQSVRRVLEQNPGAAILTVSASETSTGAYHPMEELAAVMREFPETLFAVDGITAVGVHALPMDALGIDVMVSGSQKAFSVPPGLAFVGASEKAWQRAERGGHPRYYFDLLRERRAQEKEQTAFTPAISLVVALRVVLQTMREEGLEAIFARHARLAAATRAGVVAAGLEIFPEVPANSVTAATVPDGISAPDVVRIAREKHGVTLAGGQEQLKPRLVRVGHLGHFDESDILVALAALEASLHELGVEVTPGAALSAAQQVFFGRE